MLLLELFAMMLLFCLLSVLTPMAFPFSVLHFWVVFLPHPTPSPSFHISLPLSPSLLPATFPLLPQSSPYINADDFNLHNSPCPFSCYKLSVPHGCSTDTFSSNHLILGLPSFSTTCRTAWGQLEQACALNVCISSQLHIQ